MNIVLKKISFNERMSEETSCFVADLYINGDKVGYCKNDGRGGCTEYHGDSKEHNEIIRAAENYFSLLPKKKAEGYDFEYQPTLESAIDDELEKYLKARGDKKMQKLMQNAILIGRPNAASYSYFKFKRPLSTIPTATLQAQVALIKSKNCTDGKQILNTNLQALGVTV